MPRRTQRQKDRSSSKRRARLERRAVRPELVPKHLRGK